MFKCTTLKNHSEQTHMHDMPTMIPRVDESCCIRDMTARIASK